MSENIDKLTKHALDRINRQFPTIHFFKPDSFKDVPVGTFVGGSVWSKLRHARWIVNPEVHIGNGLTYADLARSWIESNVEVPVKRKRADEPMEHAPIPHLARVGYYKDMAYVDIKSTYRTILQTCGFDVEYRPLRWLSRGLATSGLDDLHKITYSAIVTLSANYYRNVRETTKDGSLKNRKLRNTYANVALYALVRDLLHCIYSDITTTVEVFYAHTEGYIVKLADIGKVGDIITRWGFNWGIKDSGNAKILGTGSYDFNGKKPKNRVTRGKITQVADSDFRDWLFSRWSRMVEAREAETSLMLTEVEV